ncbi:MAG: DoxX family protein [Owenweeksia sp.]|nr:DoxX family protein [Owenweeksia sp.]
MRIDLGKLILRVGMSALMIPHGYSKLEKLINEGSSASFADPFGVGFLSTLIVAILAELVCPVLIILGWKTRWASVLPIITMATAALVIHIDDPWRKIEFPLLYLCGYLAIALLGAGRWSIDRK